MAMFVGEFETTLDAAKRRLAIPAALREDIDPEIDGSGWVLVLGNDRHLWLYPNGYYKRLLNQKKRSLLPKRQDRLVGMMFAMARQLKPDSQGRVVLPERSMKRAILDENITLVGMDDHIEVWPSEEWEKHVDEILPNYGEMLFDAAERMDDAEGRAE